jgi:hypothetical protein
MVCGAKVANAEMEKRLAAIEHARGSVAHLAPGRNLADELIADRRGGHAEYRITITMAGYGADADAAETLLESFLEKHPECGPVVSRNREVDTLSVTFSLKASGQEHALKLGQVVWAEGGATSGLQPTHVVRAEVESIEESAPA